MFKPVKKFRLHQFKTFKTYGREASGETWFRMVQGQAKFDYNPALIAYPQFYKMSCS